MAEKKNILDALKEAGVSDDLLAEVQKATVPSDNVDDIAKYISGLDDKNPLRRGIDKIVSQKAESIQKNMLETKLPEMVNQAVLEIKSKTDSEAAERLIEQTEDPVKRELMQLRRERLEDKKRVDEMTTRLQTQERQSKIMDTLANVKIENKENLISKLTGTSTGTEVAEQIADSFRGMQEQLSKYTNTDKVLSSGEIPEGGADIGNAVSDDSVEAALAWTQPES